MKFYRNPGVQTIEEELLKALLDAKYITQEDFENAQNAQFQRSSRTDKGVSAAEQVVSLKLRKCLNKTNCSYLCSSVHTISLICDFINDHHL